MFPCDVLPVLFYIVLQAGIGCVGASRMLAGGDSSGGGADQLEQTALAAATLGAGGGGGNTVWQQMWGVEGGGGGDGKLALVGMGLILLSQVRRSERQLRCQSESGFQV